MDPMVTLGYYGTIECTLILPEIGIGIGIGLGLGLGISFG